MQIIIDPHTLQRARERGASKDEITDTLRTGTLSVAKQGRKSKSKAYDFNAEWCGKRYEQKKIVVIFTERGNTVITVTVYVFYGKWNEV